MECPDCHQNIGDHHRTCPVCEADVGFPNVRAALHPDELAALQKRWEAAHAVCSAATLGSLASDLEVALKQSKAVMCRSWGAVDRVVSNDNILFSTFYLELDGGVRTPEDNAFDKARLAVDASIFPFYSRYIRFAALSLDGLGPMAYGPCSIVLKEAIIGKRATLFEENTLVFCRRHNLVVGTPIPRGYRATWSDRHRLGVAKLHQLLTPSMTAKDFPRLVLGQDALTDKTDFIEVHIYGSLNRHAIEVVVGPKPQSEEDRVIVSSIERKLKEVGSRVLFG
jgi:hypothetical protein